MLLSGKRGVILGVGSNRSIAYGIAQALSEQGAELAFTYAGPSFEKRVRPLAEGLESRVILPCDVNDERQIEELFSTLEQEFGSLDFLVHSLAFAGKEELQGGYVDTSREGFKVAMETSVYSLVALSRAALPLLKERKGAILTLTYYGAQKVIPHYNVMGVAKAALEASVRYLAADLGPQGVRINAISAGPIRTFAAAAIGDFSKMLDRVEETAPLRRNTDPLEVGKTAVFLLSDLSSGVTGDVVFVDCGYNIIGLV